MTQTPILLSWSGGKDAAWALHVLRQRDDVEVVGLVTTITEGYERVAMQGIRVDVLHAQAAAVELPVIEARMPQHASNDSYEATFTEALANARALWPQLSHIAFGDLFLADIRAYREALCAKIGWTPRFPLFGSDTTTLARTMLAAGLQTHLCCVDTQQLDAAFAGRVFDAELLEDLELRIQRAKLFRLQVTELSPMRTRRKHRGHTMRQKTPKIFKCLLIAASREAGKSDGVPCLRRFQL